MKRRHLIAALVLLIFFLLFRFVGEIGRETVSAYKVIRIIDGDTFELADRGRVRLLGIDAPEKGEIFHDSAVTFLKDLVLDKEVSLKFGFRKRDEYGRLLAYVYLDTLFINASILQSGLGNIYLFRDNLQDQAVLDRLLAAQHDALDNNIGIWSLPYIEEAYYIGNSNTLRLHRPDCASVARLKDANRVIFQTREEAFYEGYSPCRNCKP